MNLTVSIAADSRYPVDRKLVRGTVRQVLESHQLTGAVIVEVSVVGDRKMRMLNRRFRNIDKPTDVLSFPLEGERDPSGALHMGDIIVSWPQARTVAVKSNRLISDVVSELVSHGLLHLLGIHHPEPNFPH